MLSAELKLRDERGEGRIRGESFNSEVLKSHLAIMQVPVLAEMGKT